MSRLARRLAVFLLVAAATAVGSSWWLYEGDLVEAVEPVVPDWNADALAVRAGLAEAPLPWPQGPAADPQGDAVPVGD